MLNRFRVSLPSSIILRINEGCFNSLLLKKIGLIFIISQFSLSCKTDKVEEPRVTSIAFESSTLELRVGEEQMLKVQHSPANLNAPDLQWSSSNQEIASVDNGKILAKSIGTATIKIFAKDLNLTSTLQVAVKAKDPTILLKSDSKELNVGEQIKVSCETNLNDNPNFENIEIEWSVNDSKLAKIENGLLTGIDQGLVQVIAKIKGTEISSSLSIQVNHIKVTSLKIISRRNGAQYMELGSSRQLKVDYMPKNATDTLFYWASEKPSVVSVSQDGLLSGKNLEQSLITVSAKSSNISATMLALVIPVPVYLELNKPFVAPDGITVTMKNITKTKVGGRIMYDFSYTFTNNSNTRKRTDTFELYNGTNDYIGTSGMYFSYDLLPGESVNKSMSITAFEDEGEAKYLQYVGGRGVVFSDKSLTWRAP